MPNSKLTTEGGILTLIEEWESSHGNSTELLWKVAWRIGALDPTKKRSALRAEWVGRAKEVNRETLQKAVNGCAAVVRLNGGNLPNKTQKARIEKHALTVFGQKAARLNENILTEKAKRLDECLNPPAKRRQSVPELIPSEKVTQESVGELLGRLMLQSTDIDPNLLVRNVAQLANNYVATVKAKQ